VNLQNTVVLLAEFQETSQRIAPDFGAMMLKVGKQLWKTQPSVRNLLALLVQGIL